MLIIFSILPVIIIHLLKAPCTLIKFEDTITGSFFFEDDSNLHITYDHYSPEYDEQFGWTLICNSKGGLFLEKNHIDEKLSIERGTNLFHNVRGAYAGGYYYLFSNGISFFFDPRAIGQRSMNLESWIPVPTFRNTTTSAYFSRFIGTQVDAMGNLIACFSDFQGFVLGQTNYTFYLLTITQDKWFLENVTFDGNLENLGKANFFLYDNQPIITWSFYNSTSDLISLKLTRKVNNTWTNHTLSYENYDLIPCGFQTYNGELNLYYYGLNYIGLYNETQLFKATINNGSLDSINLFSYSSRLSFSDRSVFQWNSGVYSIFFQDHSEFNTSIYYGEINSDKEDIVGIRINDSTSQQSAIQMEIRNEIIFLMWNEVFLNPNPDESDTYTLYLCSFNNISTLASLNQESFQTVFWIQPHEELVTLTPHNKNPKHKP